MKHALALLLVISALAASQTAPKSQPAGEQLLRSADRAFNEDTAKRRLEGWMSAFSDNAVLFADKPIVGKDAIRAFYQPNFADSDFSLSWQPTRAEMFSSGDMGYTTGRWELHGKDAKGNKVVRHGNYLTVWKKQSDGSWKVIADGGASDPH